MCIKNYFHSSAILALVFTFISSHAFAEAPDLQTPSPVIYLADNLDEADKLGWCIDTVGRGFADRLHAHSCKPSGGDVQFSYDESSSQIKSATFDNKCAEINGELEAGVSLNLLDCDADNVNQHFVYDASTQTIKPKADDSLCLMVGENGRSAGPFMSRSLFIDLCKMPEKKFIQWMIK